MNRQILDDEVRKANKELHDIEASCYDILHNEIWNFCEQTRTRQDLKKIIEMIKKETLNVLDVGAGTGNLALKFLSNENVVTALDISERMLEVLSNKIHNRFRNCITLICGDVAEFLLETKQKYDVICFSAVLHHLPDYLYTLDQAILKLNEGGVIYITHEPLPRKNSFVYHNLGRVFGLIDSYLNLLRLSKYSKRGLPNLDYSISDIHSKEGINPKKIIAFLESKGMGITSYKEYGTYKSGIISIFGTFFSDRKNFKLIAKKSKNA